MIERTSKVIHMRVLMVDDDLASDTASGRASRALVQDLQGRDVEVVEAATPEDGHSVVGSDSAIHAILLDWTLGSDRTHAKATRLLEFVRGRNDKIPIFLMAEREQASSIPVPVMEMADEFIWMLEDTAAFIGGRVVAAIRRYDALLLPPMAAALFKFAAEYRVLVAHARAHRRHGVPEVAGRQGLLRLLRREPPPIGPVHQRRRPRVAARSHRPDRRAREVRGPRLRRRPVLQRDQRELDVEPDHLHGRRRPRPGGPVRPQLPQVDRARARADRGHSHLPGPDAEPVRDHRSHPPEAPPAEGHPGRGRGEPARARERRARARPGGHHELHL